MAFMAPAGSELLRRKQALTDNDVKIHPLLNSYLFRWYKLLKLCIIWVVYIRAQEVFRILKINQNVPKIYFKSLLL